MVHLPYEEGLSLFLDAQSETVWHIQVNWKGWDHLLSIRMKFSVTLTVNISLSHMTRNISPLESTICFQKLKIKKSEFDILTMIESMVALDGPDLDAVWVTGVKISPVTRENI